MEVARDLNFAVADILPRLMNIHKSMAFWQRNRKIYSAELGG